MRAGTQATPGFWPTLCLAVASTLGLGLPFLLIDIAQRELSTPLMAAIRVALAAGLLVILTSFSSAGVREDLLLTLRHRPISSILIALSAAVLPNLLIGTAERHVPSGTTAMLVASTPIWISIIGIRVGTEARLNRRQWTSLGFAVLGVGLACGATVPQQSLVWCLLPLAAALSYAIGNLLIRHRFAEVSPLAITAIEMICAALILNALLIPQLRTEPGLPHIGTPTLIAVAIAGIGCSGLGWWANTALIQRVGAARASLVSYAAVIVSVALGALVLHEPFGLRSALGTAILITAIAVYLAPTPTWSALGDRVRKGHTMLELSILGFLAEEPLHAYEIRRRIHALSGHSRPISDGALRPALQRLQKHGFIHKVSGPGDAGPPRQTCHLTPAGRAELEHRLAEPEQTEITDGSRFFTLLAFLHLITPAQQRSVLERRLAFLEVPGRGFFLSRNDTRPAENEPAPDPQPSATAQPTTVFRDGMLLMARDTSRTERRWLHDTVDALPA